MRFVDRSSVPAPKILSSPLAERARHEVRQILALDEKKREHVRAKFDYKLLKHPEVKSALVKLFRGKCAYCETPVAASGWDLESLRPKSSAAGVD